MDSVTSRGTIRFSNEIISTSLYGKEYTSLGGNELQTVEGTSPYNVGPVATANSSKLGHSTADVITTTTTSKDQKKKKIKNEAKSA